MSDSKAPGISILHMIPGSPSEKAGLKIGDIVFSIDNIPISSLDDAANAIANRKGDMHMSVLRDNDIKEIIVPMSTSVISEAPAVMNSEDVKGYN